MKTNFRRNCALLLAISAFIMPACNKGTEKIGTDSANIKQGLTDAQKANIFAISEAFVEYGKSYNSNEPLTVAEMESFVYYLYNGELKAGDDGYFEISADEAVSRIKMYFGIESVLHKSNNSSDLDYYFSNGKYFIHEKPSVVNKTDIVSVNADEGTVSSVAVEAFCNDGSRVLLDFRFKLDGDSTLVLSCTRYDEQ